MYRLVYKIFKQIIICIERINIHKYGLICTFTSREACKYDKDCFIPFPTCQIIASVG